MAAKSDGAIDGLRTNGGRQLGPAGVQESLGSSTGAFDLLEISRHSFSRFS
jgi:hypothetical protein